MHVPVSVDALHAPTCQHEDGASLSHNAGALDTEEGESKKEFFAFIATSYKCEHGCTQLCAAHV